MVTVIRLTEYLAYQKSCWNVRESVGIRVSRFVSKLPALFRGHLGKSLHSQHSSFLTCNMGITKPVWRICGKYLMKTQWGGSRINYLLLCYLVAKKHTKKHILKQHTSEKSAMGRNTGFQLHDCNWLVQWFSRWDSGAGSIKVTWELDKNADYQAPPQTHWILSSGSGAQQQVFSQALQVILILILEENHCISRVCRGGFLSCWAFIKSLNVWLHFFTSFFLDDCY